MRRAVLSLPLFVACAQAGAQVPAPAPDVSAPAPEAATAAAQADPITQDATTLDTLVVTGERVRRTQRDTLSSVTVLTAEEIDRSGERGVYEVVVGAPNITPAPGEFLPPIRGDESGGPGGLFGGVLFGTQPRATLIVDDVPRISAGSNNSATSIFDVAQVEVLRGPQTTLRGANAISGAFLIATQRPTFELEGAGLAEIVDNDVVDPTYRVAAMINAPVSQDVSTRFTAERIDGYVPIRVRATDPEFPAPADLDLEELSAFERNRFRGQMLLRPAAAPEFELLVQSEYEDGVDVGFDSFVNNEIYNGGVDIEERIFAYPNPRLLDTRLRFLSANASYRFDGDLALRSITSWQDSRLDDNERSADPFVGFDQINEDRFIQDLILSFGGEQDTVAGLVGGTVSRGEMLNRLSGFDFDTRGTRDEEALFADLTARLTDRVNLLAGGRLNRSRVTQTADAFGTFNAIDFEEQRTDFLPKLGVSVALESDATLAVTARRGLNAGGAGIDFLTFGPYEWSAETVWTYEAAYRRAFGRRITVGVTLFYSDYEDKQFYIQSDVNPDSFKVANLPVSRSYGLEAEARAQLTSTLSATAGIGLLETKVTDPPADSLSLDGNTIGTDPPFTGSLGLVWEPVPGLELGGRIVSVAEYDSDVTNRSDERAGGYTLVDLDAAYRFGAFTARVFVNNVFDEFAVYQRLADSGVYVNPPRTVGASLEARF